MMARLQFGRVRLLTLAIFFGSCQTFVANQLCAQGTTPPGVITPTAPVDPAADIVCEHLMADYVLRQRKIGSDDIEAAIQLIASRSHGGYWRTVYRHFKETEVNSYGWSPSAGLLKILTKMLARDGRARWLRSRPEEMKRSAWVATVTLPAEVLDTIIERARKADRLQFDAYVMTIATAYDPRSKPFLLDVLHARLPAVANSSPYGTADPKPSQFNAAIGLSNLGEREGVAWLVETEIGNPAQHEARLRALSELTGQPHQPLENWQAWWRQNPVPERFEPKARAHPIAR